MIISCNSIWPYIWWRSCMINSDRMIILPIVWVKNTVENVAWIFPENQAYLVKIIIIMQADIAHNSDNRPTYSNKLAHPNKQMADPQAIYIQLAKEDEIVRACDRDSNGHRKHVEKYKHRPKLMIEFPSKSESRGIKIDKLNSHHRIINLLYFIRCSSSHWRHQEDSFNNELTSRPCCEVWRKFIDLVKEPLFFINFLRINFHDINT